MQREMPPHRWMALVRRRTVGCILLGIIAAATTLWVSAHIPRGPIFAGVAGWVDAAAPWTFGAALLWIAGWSSWLASTYLVPEWWGRRWARAQGYEVS